MSYGPVISTRLKHCCCARVALLAPTRPTSMIDSLMPHTRTCMLEHRLVNELSACCVATRQSIIACQCWCITRIACAVTSSPFGANVRVSDWIMAGVAPTVDIVATHSWHKTPRSARSELSDALTCRAQVSTSRVTREDARTAVFLKRRVQPTFRVQALAM